MQDRGELFASLYVCFYRHNFTLFNYTRENQHILHVFMPKSRQDFH